MASKKEKNYYDLREIENYCRTKTFTKSLGGKWEKANFRQTAKRFSVKNGQLYYKEGRLVIIQTSHSKAVSAHFERTPIKKLLHVSFSMGFTTMLETTYKNVIVVKHKVVCHLT